MIEVANKKAPALTAIGSNAVFFDTIVVSVYQLQIS